MIKFPPKSYEQFRWHNWIFLSENLKQTFPPQLPGRRYVRESSLGTGARGCLITVMERYTGRNAKFLKSHWSFYFITLLPSRRKESSRFKIYPPPPKSNKIRRKSLLCKKTSFWHKTIPPMNFPRFQAKQ